MSRVICDVCGTAYPESSVQCPICGSAKAVDASGAAGGSDQNLSENTSYAYVKGGRFSKRNVRRRATKGSSVQERRRTPARKETESNDDGNDKGLIIAVVVLLLAIIAVVIYIAVRFIPAAPGNLPEDTKGSEFSTTPSEDQDDPTVPVTGMTLIDVNIVFDDEGDTWTLRVDLAPEDTTEVVTFSSAGENIATVDESGVVTAVGSGRTTITVTCGTFTQQCIITCNFEDPTQEPTQPEDPTEPSAPTEPPAGEFNFVFRWAQYDEKTGMYDSTITNESTWRTYSDSLTIDPSQITWISDDPSICTIENGIVTVVGKGTTKIHAQYGGKTVTCIVRCRIVETNTTPDEPAQTAFAFNAPDEYYKNGKWDTSFSLSQQTTWKAYREGSQLKAEDMTWSVDDPSICTVDGKGVVTLLTPGTTEIHAKHGDTTYTCIVRISD